MEDKHNLNNTLHSYKQKLVKYQEEVIESNAIISDLNMQYATSMNQRINHMTTNEYALDEETDGI